MATDTATGVDAIETSSSDDDDGGSSSTRPEYVSLFVLFGAMLMIALLCTSWYVLSRRDRRLFFNSRPHDAEAAGVSLAAARLDAIAPVISNKRWRLFKASKPPPNFRICVICLDELQGRQEVRNLPCGHGFHDECITKWFTERQEICPVCKRNYGLGTTNVYVALPQPVFSRP